MRPISHQFLNGDNYFLRFDEIPTLIVLRIDYQFIIENYIVLINLDLVFHMMILFTNVSINLLRPYTFLTILIDFLDLNGFDRDL